MAAGCALFWLLLVVAFNSNGDSAKTSPIEHPPRLAPNSHWSEQPVREIKSCLSPELEDEERKTCRFFAAVIDAGSTGTRLHLFEFSHDPAHAHSPFKVEGEVKPGLSAFAAEPESAAESVRGLLQAAREVVPAALWRHSPLVLKATAGLRLLPDAQADAVLRHVEAEVRRSGLLLDADAVGILSGTDEGVYGWFTLNFLVDRLGQDAKETAVALDLGGGSTQITFVPADPRRVFSRQTPERDFGHSLTVFGSKIRLYTHSYLGNGLVATRMGIGRLLATEKSEKQRQMVTHCFPANYTLRDFDSSGRSWTIKSSSTAGFSNCLQQTKKYVEKTEIRNVSAILDRDIYAFGYIYDRTKQAGLLDGADASGRPVRLGDLREAARTACAMRGTEISGAENWKPWQCLDLTYIYTLLTHGYGLTDEHHIYPTKKIRGYEVSWALGEAFHLLNTYHEKAQRR